MILQKDKLTILSEAAETEEFNTDNVFIGGVLDDISKELNFIPELDEELEYTEEMVNVLLQETTHGNRYLVELENLVKLSESTGMDIKESLHSVCEHNSISIGDTYVVIESIDSILESAKKLSKLNDIKSKADLTNTLKSVQDLKDKGIKLMARSSKKKVNKKKRKK